MEQEQRSRTMSGVLGAVTCRQRLPVARAGNVPPVQVLVSVRVQFSARTSCIAYRFISRFVWTQDDAASSMDLMQKRKVVGVFALGKPKKFTDFRRRSGSTSSQLKFSLFVRSMSILVVGVKSTQHAVVKICVPKVRGSVGGMLRNRIRRNAIQIDVPRSSIGKYANRGSAGQ